MRGMLPLFTLLCCAAAAPGLPAPSGLRVNHIIGEDVVVSTPRPRFSFLPHTDADLEGMGKGAAMKAYRITVQSQGAAVWDSGVVNASGAVAVMCGKALAPLSTYTWTAQWFDATGVPSPTTRSSFHMGPSTAGDWAGSVWLGNTQNEFKITLPPTNSNIWVYVASPGGYTLTGGEGGETVYGDPTGLSRWSSFTQTVVYQGHRVAKADVGNALFLSLGRGFLIKSTQINITRGWNPDALPVARVLIVSEDNKAAVTATIRGRAGVVSKEDVFQGVTMDWTRESLPWEAVAEVPAALQIPAALPALGMPHAKVSPQVTAGMVSDVVGVKDLGDGSWLYTFSRNIVGHTAVMPGAFTVGPQGGSLTLSYCETFNTTSNTCVGYSVHPLVRDTHVLTNTTRSGHLTPKFTWHGFQYVHVTVSGDLTWHPKAESLQARWTVIDVERSGNIEFKGPGSALLTQLQSMVFASQISNIAAYIPTDCPTREKHGWLGDALEVSEEAMYNVYAPYVWEAFVQAIQDDQNADTGECASVVPKHPPGPTATSDLSWTAAFPLVASHINTYYGDITAVRTHWTRINSYMAGRKERAGKGVVPSFSNFGDWNAMEPKQENKKGTGPGAAAGNFIVATEAMATLAEDLGEGNVSAMYRRDLEDFRADYAQRFYNTTLGTYSNRSIEVQTLSSVALAANISSHHASVLAALTSDVAARGDHLTTGSAGEKFLLPQLTAQGYHDTALRLALQTTYPSWGYWASQGATTCWENWSGHNDYTQPGGNPTHNHIFLCGGLGEWLYRSLLGIAPAAPGYEKVKIAPQISPTEGPSGVAGSVATVRGLVASNWTRYASPDTPTSLSIRVPVGMMATVEIPTLEHPPEGVSLVVNGIELWAGGEYLVPAAQVFGAGVRIAPAAAPTRALVLEGVPSGVFELLVKVPYPKL